VGRKTKRTGKAGRRHRPRKAEARLAYTVLHPVRLDILAILLDRVASANEIAVMLNEPHSTVRRHIKELRDNQMIEVVDERPRGGAMERYYRAVVQPVISGEEAEVLPRAANRRHAAISLQNIFTEALASLRHKQMDADEELELSLLRSAFSRRGLEEMNALLAEMQERFGAIVERDATRPKSDSAPIKVVATMFFDQGRPGGMPRARPDMP
jgi:DNA-binding transcriptional ArsR family regulator